LCCSPGRLGRTHYAPALVDPDARRDIDELERRTDGVRRIDQRRKSRMGFVVPRSGGRFSVDILGGSDDLEILALQFFIDFLPAWQIEAAPSPRGPSHH
jgi:hypothetical protein